MRAGNKKYDHFSIRAPRKPQSVCIHTLGPQIHPWDFQSVHENDALKSIGGSKNNP